MFPGLTSRCTVDDLRDGEFLDELHRDEVVTARFAELEDLHDVAVHQAHGELRLIAEGATLSIPLMIG